MYLTDEQKQVLNRVSFQDVLVKNHPNEVDFSSLQSFILSTVGPPKFLAMDEDGTVRSFLSQPSKRDNQGKWVSNRSFAKLNKRDAKILSFILPNHEYPYDIKHMLHTGTVQTTERNTVEETLENGSLTKYEGSKSDLSISLNNARDLGRIVVAGNQKDFTLEERVNAVFFQPDAESQTDLFYSIARINPQLLVIDSFYWKNDLSELGKSTQDLNSRGYPVILV